MDKMTKQTKAAKAKAEEEALNRVLCWVAGGAVLEFLLMLLNRYWSHYTAAQIDLRVALGTAVKILAVAALVCAAGALYWWQDVRKSGKSANMPGTLCLFMAGVSASCFGAWFFSEKGLELMCYLVPAVVVLALIYYLYQREFFLIAGQSALTLLGIWVCGRGLGSAQAWICYGYGAVVVLLAAGSALLCRKAQADNGAATLGGKKRQLFHKEANYALMYLGALVTVAVTLAAMLGLTQMALYGVAVAWLLVMAVYYTVKLM